MKVSVVYNVRAGGGVMPEDLRSRIRRGGHEVLAMIGRREIARDLPPASEVVVVAGGDGTVRDVAIELVDRRIPLAVLPLGTANNIAMSLGIAGPIEELIGGWQTDDCAALDLGVALGPWGSRRFIESVGAGLIADGIHDADQDPPDEDAGPERARSETFGRFHAALARMTAHPCVLTVDGDRSEEDLLLVEVLNICAIGPGLWLVRDADPTDGFFDVVTAGEQHRAEVEGYLRARAARRPTEIRLPTRRARRVEILGFERIHVDDAIERVVERRCAMYVEHAAIHVLRPRP